MRADYLALPVSLAYCQHEHGQGFQVFAGPYLALLLGGRFTNTLTYPKGTETISGKITPGDGGGPLSERYDAGVQAGLGYRYKALLFQADYSLGLRSIGGKPISSNRGAPEPNKGSNRTFQTSVSYLFTLTGK